MINKEDYRDMNSLMNWGKYAEALEDYCYELERMNGNQRDTVVHFRTRCEELEKALDKVCEEIDGLFYEYVPSSNCPFIWDINEDEFERLKKWKEWCLKDEPI